MRTVDAHLHLWNRADGYRWLDGADEALRRDVTAEEAEAELRAAGVDTAVLVQADDTEADTEFLLDTAEAYDWIAGVVGWVPIDDATRAERLLDHWADRRLLRGVRQLLHDDPRDGLLSTPHARRLAVMLAERDLVLDVPNAFPRLLGDATALASAVTDLTVVVDHLAKPPTDPAGFDVWSAQRCRTPSRRCRGSARPAVGSLRTTPGGRGTSPSTDSVLIGSWSVATGRSPSRVAGMRPSGRR
jgi:L-fuconolactonase